MRVSQETISNFLQVFFKKIFLGIKGIDILKNNVNFFYSSHYFLYFSSCYVLKAEKGVLKLFNT